MPEKSIPPRRNATVKRGSDSTIERKRSFEYERAAVSLNIRATNSNVPDCDKVEKIEKADPRHTRTDTSEHRP